MFFFQRLCCIFRKNTRCFHDTRITAKETRGFSVPIVNWINVQIKICLIQFLSVSQLNRHQRPFKLTSIQMDTYTTLGGKLSRLNTNDSTPDSIFSRNNSSSSVATNLHHSLSFTKISEESIKDALQINLSRSSTRSSGQPRSVNVLTTTPTNESAINTKWCVILVGLPAVGKSSICKNLIKHTTVHLTHGIDLNFKIGSFNAGHYRRTLSDFQRQDSTFFDFANQEAKSQREKFAHIALDHLLNSLCNSQLDVGIFDATNSTKQRRDDILSTIKQKEEISGVKINTVILHVKCSDSRSWRFNVEGKTSGPDYINTDHDAAIEDFIHRANLYKAAFEDIDDDELKTHPGLVYLELDNCGKQYKIENNGFEQDDLVFNELQQFVESYYEKYGDDYDAKVNQFWKR